MSFSKIYIFITLSIFIHLIIAGGISFKKDPFKNKKNEVEITILEAPRTTTPEKLKQIVEQNQKSLNDETPEKEAYLSQFNQRVNKETQAQKTGKFNNSNGQNGQQQELQTQKQTQKNVKKLNPNKFSLNSLVPKLKIDPESAKKKYQGQAGQESQTDDYLKDINPGIETVLNTREFLYYSYYSRIKEKIRQHWGHRVREKVNKLFQSGRSLASTNDHITKIVIVLNKEGILEKVLVRSASGIHDLDEAAIEAFKAAAPFPNPPKGMVEKDGKIRINWDFILEA